MKPVSAFARCFEVWDRVTDGLPISDSGQLDLGVNGNGQPIRLPVSPESTARSNGRLYRARLVPHEEQVRLDGHSQLPHDAAALVLLRLHGSNHWWSPVYLCPRHSEHLSTERCPLCHTSLTLLHGQAYVHPPGSYVSEPMDDRVPWVETIEQGKASLSYSGPHGDLRVNNYLLLLRSGSEVIVRNNHRPNRVLARFRWCDEELTLTVRPGVSFPGPNLAE